MFNKIVNSKKQRYLPHDVNTRYHAVKLYLSGYDIKFICRRYKISTSSLRRWYMRFDGTKESLKDKSHRPHTKHPNSHTDEEIKNILNILHRNPNISLDELYGKLLRQKNYTRNYASLYRMLVKLGYRKNNQKTNKKYIPKKYDTPIMIGIKWQIDVKEVPKKCYVGEYENNFFQYTVIDEATRERFIYPYQEQSSYSSFDFVKKAIKYFGYKPKIIQTDNGTEFTNTRLTEKIHLFDILLNELEIKHQTIRPRTPRHNGKVERSHGLDEYKFYKSLRFYSYEDLIKQIKVYLKKSNNTPRKLLNWKTPIEKRKELLSISQKEQESIENNK